MRPGARRPRRLAAWLCLVALVAGAVALPALHAAQHLHEQQHADGADRAHAPYRRARLVHALPQRVAHPHAHDHAHDDGDAGDGEHGHRAAARARARERAPHDHRHHHDGDRPGEHGAHSAAHLALLIAPASSPAIPPHVSAVTRVEPTFLPRPVTVAAHRRAPIRAPPATTA